MSFIPTLNYSCEQTWRRLHKQCKLARGRRALKENHCVLPCGSQTQEKSGQDLKTQLEDFLLNSIKLYTSSFSPILGSNPRV